MKIEWLDRSIGVSPVFYCLCVTRDQFRAAVKHLNVPMLGDKSFFATDRGNATTHFFTKTDKTECAIVTIDIDVAKHSDPIETFGLLVHEAVHIVQHGFELIGERQPGIEIEAYAIQWIAQQLLASYVKQFKALLG